MERLTIKYNGENILLCGYCDGDQCDKEDCAAECPCKCEQDAIDRLASYEDAEEQGLLVRLPCWIPVTERLPEKGKYVLVRYKNNDMTVACWFDGDEDILFWRAMTDEGWYADCDTDPTHWMPLPNPPKEV